MTENMNEKMENLMELATKNFEVWNQSLQPAENENGEITRDPEGVAKLYAKDNTFLPTVSGDFKKGVDGAKDYFKHFLEKNPFGEVVDEKVNEISPECYVHSGKYDFKVDGVEQGSRTVVHAEFSFVWKLNNGKWEIEHHHSSAIKPEDEQLREEFAKAGKMPEGEPKDENDKEFFQKFFEDNKLGRIMEDEIRMTSKDKGAFLHTGLYETNGAEARFTLNWKKEDGGWKLIQSHLSVRPVVEKSSEEKH